MYFNTGAQLQAALNALPSAKVGQFVAFDALYYQQTYMNAAAAGVAPIDHFVTIGAPSGAKPNAVFDPVFYKQAWADLKDTSFDAADLLYHFMMYGLDEGRAPNAELANFDGPAYLAAYPDVAAYVNGHLSDFNGSATNGAIAHYVKFGAAQGFEPVFSGSLTYTLTNDIDTATANIFNSAPAYTPGGDEFINTLQDEDVLTGTGENPTLNLTVGTANDGAESTITPTLNGISTINVQVSGASGANDGATFGGLNLQDATGLEAINVTRITGTNNTVEFTELQDSVTSLSLSNSTNGGTVLFEHKEEVLTGTDEVLEVALTNVRNNGVTFAEAGDGVADLGFYFEEVNVAANGTNDIDELTIAANGREDVLLEQADDTTKQALNIVAGAAAGASGSLEINTLNITGVDNMTIVANHRVDIASDKEMPLDDSDGINSADLETLTITGAANVRIDGLEGQVGAFQDSQGLTVDGSAMTGNLRLGIVGGTSADDLLSVESGSGDDEIRAFGNLGGDVVTNTGDDVVTVDSDMLGTASIDTGADDDIVSADDMNAIEDEENNGNQSFGEAEAASIVTGNGDDTVSVDNLNSAVDWNNGVSLLDQTDDSYFIKGASIDTGAGDDSVTFDSAAEGTLISTGDDVDTVSVTLDGTTVLAADDTDDVAGVNGLEVGLDGEVDELGAVLTLGADNDTISFTDVDSDNEVGGDDNTDTLLVDVDALLDGGDGADTLNVTALDAVTVVAIAQGEAGDANGADDFNAYVTGIEVANLTIANQIEDDGGVSALINETLGLAVNDGDDTDGFIQIDVQRFDEDLAEVNLLSEEQALETDVANEDWEAGTSTEFVVDNLRAGVALSLSANEATGVGVVDAIPNQLLDDEEVDVVLTINMADASGAADSFTLDVGAPNATYAGAEDLDLDITLNETASYPAGIADDTDYLVENLVINLEAGGSHFIDMNGFGDDQFANSEDNVGSFMQWRNLDPVGNMLQADYDALPDAGVAGGAFVPNDKSDFGQGFAVETSFTINDTVEGEFIHVINVNADDISILGAADVELEVDFENNYTIITGTGEDRIDMFDDLVDDEDAIDGGTGSDNTLVIDGANSMGFDDGIQTENDEVWINKSNIQILEMRTAGTDNATVVLDEEAFETGVREINVVDDDGANTGDDAQGLEVIVGEDFVRDLLITTDSTLDAVALTFTNHQDEENKTLNVELDAEDGTSFTLDDEFDRYTVNLTIGLANGDDGGNDETDVSATEGPSGAAAAPSLANTDDGDVDINVVNGAIAKIVFVDNNDEDADGTAGESVLGTDAEDNGDLNVTIHDSWATDALEIDASAIGNDDLGDDNNADSTINGIDTILANASGGMTFDGSAETDAALTVKGTANNDDITGGDMDDTLNGNAGNDDIFGGQGDDTIDGGADDDELFGEEGDDTLLGGDGDDEITGALGADTLTGGADADIFFINSVDESTQSTADTITDFVTGTDTLQIEMGTVAGDDNVVNFGRFNTVSNLGAGDNSLDGTTIDPVIGDAYYSTSGQFVVDVDGNGDITDLDDVVVNSPNAIDAGDVNYTIDLTGNDNLIRLGQGVEDIVTTGDNNIFVIVGEITADDRADYTTAGSGVVDASIDQVLPYNDLLSVRSTTEATAGDSIDALGANDLLHVYGTTDLTVVDFNAGSVETLVVHSTVTISDEQLDDFVSIIVDGDTTHTIIIEDTDNDDTTGTVAQLLAKLSLVNMDTNSTLTIVGADGTLVAEYDTVADELLVVSDSSDVGAAVDDPVDGLGGAQDLSNQTVAAATDLYALGYTNYIIVDTYTEVSGAAAAVLADADTVTATGVTGDISGDVNLDGANVDVLQLLSGASATVTANQASKIDSAAGTNTLTIAAGTIGTIAADAAVENYVIGDENSDNASAISGITGAQTVTATSGSDAVTVGVSGTFTGALTGEGTVNDVVSLSNGANIAGGTISNFEDLTIATGGSVTMTAAQHTAFSGTVTAAGNETITLSGDGAVTTKTAVETYSIGDDSTNARTVTVSGAAQTVTASSASDAITFAFSGALTGTLTGEGTVDDILSLANGSSIAGGTVTNVEALTLANNASVTMTAAQNNAFTGALTAAGAETIVISGNGAVTTLGAAVETYTIGDDSTNARSVTVSGLAQAITAASATDAITFNVSGALTGTLTGEATVDDVLSLATGSTIAGGTVTNVEGLTIATNGSVTMTAAQHTAFSGTVTAAGSETITISGDGAVTTKTAVETYVVGDDSGNARTITVSGAAQSVTATTANDAVTFAVSGTSTATLVGEGTTDDILSLATGANIAGATLTAIEALTIAAGGSVSMTAAQLNAFTGTITAAGSETITLTTAGTVTLASVIETVVLANGTNVLTFNGAAAQSATAGTGSDTFVLTVVNGATNISTGNDTITGFNVAADVLDVNATSFQTISAAATNLTVVAGGVVEIAASYVETLNATAVGAGAGIETIIAGAIADADTTLANGDELSVVIYGGGNAYVYGVTVTTASADMVVGEFEIDLIGTVNGVAADSLTSANFI